VTRASRGRARIAVVGGAGAMGRIVVRDLAETAPDDVEIVVADRDLRAARAVAGTLPRKVTAVKVDAARARRLASALRGTSVLINACHHSLNLSVMDAALRVGSHYCDLGGLFHMTRRQLRRHGEFRRAGRLALLGMGSAPGIVNVMARAGAERLDAVREIHIAVGTRDRTRRQGQAAIETSYSIETVLDEASLPAALFTGGALRFVEPLSQVVRVNFPAPVGAMPAACTLHSELATLPQSFREMGIREASFRIAFPGDLADRLRFVRSLGLLSREGIAVDGRVVVPRRVLLALLANIPPRPASGPRDEYEILRVVVRGRRGRRMVEEVIDCYVPGMPRWDIGVDIDTGAPPSIAAQMIVQGVITARGVLPPERAVPPEPFFRALRARQMRVTHRTVQGRD
jgi:saccharopine dehydrogenase-like NADP-dependent oxidoreductase